MFDSDRVFAFLRPSNPYASASRPKAKADARKAEASIPCKANGFYKEGQYEIKLYKIQWERNLVGLGEVCEQDHAWTLEKQHDHMIAYDHM